MLDEWFHSKDFFGCNFIHASAEYAQENRDIQSFAAEHKDRVRQLLLEYVPGNNRQIKTMRAGQLALLVDGAIVKAHTVGDKRAAKMAKDIARLLLAD